MLTYRAMYKFVDGGVHAEVLDFPGVITSGRQKRRLAACLPAPWLTWRRRTCFWASRCPVPIPAERTPNPTSRSPSICS